VPDAAPLSGEVEGHLGSAYVNLGDVSGSVRVRGGLGTLIRGEQWWAIDGVMNIPGGSEDVWVVVTNVSSVATEYEVVLGPSATEGEDTGGEPVAAREGRELGAAGPKSGGCAAVQIHTRGGVVLALLGLICGFRFRSE
jgi:hypothetical protein